MLLSHAATQVGSGFGFGLHEALDQIGAVSGPLAVAAILAWKQQAYSTAFAILIVPALAGLLMLLWMQRRYPNPREFEPKAHTPNGAGLPRRFWVYLAGVALLALGYADFPLIAFHFQQSGVMSSSQIAVLYAVAMATDAIAALVLGRLFDRYGALVVAIALLGSSLSVPLVFLGNAAVALLGMALWGLGMGTQESILKATVATMVPSERRGAAFGLCRLWRCLVCRQCGDGAALRSHDWWTDWVSCGRSSGGCGGVIDDQPQAKVSDNIALQSKYSN